MTTILDVVAAVANDFGVPIHHLIALRRKYSVPRQIAMFLASELTSKSLPQIGRAMERDHSTVIFGMARTAARIQQEPAFAERVNRIRKHLTPEVQL